MTVYIIIMWSMFKTYIYFFNLLTWEVAVKFRDILQCVMGIQYSSQPFIIFQSMKVYENNVSAIFVSCCSNNCRLTVFNSESVSMYPVRFPYGSFLKKLIAAMPGLQLPILSCAPVGSLVIEQLHCECFWYGTPKTYIDKMGSAYVSVPACKSGSCRLGFFVIHKTCIIFTLKGKQANITKYGRKKLLKNNYRCIYM